MPRRRSPEREQFAQEVAEDEELLGFIDFGESDVESSHAEESDFSHSGNKERRSMAESDFSESGESFTLSPSPPRRRRSQSTRATAAAAAPPRQTDTQRETERETGRQQHADVIDLGSVDSSPDTQRDTEREQPRRRLSAAGSQRLAAMARQARGGQSGGNPKRRKPSPARESERKRPRRQLSQEGKRQRQREQLVSMGFTEEDSTRALALSQGHVEEALELLTSGAAMETVQTEGIERADAEQRDIESRSGDGERQQQQAASHEVGLAGLNNDDDFTELDPLPQSEGKKTKLRRSRPPAPSSAGTAAEDKGLEGAGRSANSQQRRASSVADGSGSDGQQQQQQRHRETASGNRQLSERAHESKQDDGGSRHHPDAGVSTEAVSLAPSVRLNQNSSGQRAALTGTRNTQTNDLRVGTPSARRRKSRSPSPSFDDDDDDKDEDSGDDSSAAGAATERETERAAAGRGPLKSGSGAQDLEITATTTSMDRSFVFDSPAAPQRPKEKEMGSTVAPPVISGSAVGGAARLAVHGGRAQKRSRLKMRKERHQEPTIHATVNPNAHESDNTQRETEWQRRGAAEDRQGGATVSASMRSSPVGTRRVQETINTADRERSSEVTVVAEEEEMSTKTHGMTDRDREGSRLKVAMSPSRPTAAADSPSDRAGAGGGDRSRLRAHRKEHETLPRHQQHQHHQHQQRRPETATDAEAERERRPSVDDMVMQALAAEATSQAAAFGVLAVTSIPSAVHRRMRASRFAAR